MPISKNGRAYTAGKFALDLQGALAGWVKELDGGHASAEVITHKVGADPLQKKQIGPVKYEEIQIKLGSSNSKALYEWINTGFNKSSNANGRKDGAIIAADFDGNELSRLTWLHGLMTEFGMPALDASSKDSAMMSIKIQPETTRKTFGGGGKLSSQLNAAKQKMWLPSNFKLQIDGVDCSKVSKVEALTIKQKVVENAVGEQRDYEREPASVEIPNLVITLAESHAKAFYDWHESFVIKGKNTEDQEKGGTLEYLSSDLNTVLFTLKFNHLGIFKLSPDKVEAANEAIRRVKVEMYCEEINFSYSSAAVFG